MNSRTYFKTQKSATFAKKNVKIKTDKNYSNGRDHCHYAGKYICAAYNLKYSVFKEIPIVSHNWSNYDYHFTIKNLAEEFEKQFTCLAENTEKQKPLQFQQKKKL